MQLGNKRRMSSAGGRARQATERRRGQRRRTRQTERGAQERGMQMGREAGIGGRGVSKRGGMEDGADGVDRHEDGMRLI